MFSDIARPIPSDLLIQPAVFYVPTIMNPRAIVALGPYTKGRQASRWTMPINLAAGMAKGHLSVELPCEQR